MLEHYIYLHCPQRQTKKMAKHYQPKPCWCIILRLNNETLLLNLFKFPLKFRHHPLINATAMSGFLKDNNKILNLKTVSSRFLLENNQKVRTGNNCFSMGDILGSRLVCITTLSIYICPVKLKWIIYGIWLQHDYQYMNEVKLGTLLISFGR